jgi:hypothetical protein
VGGALLLVGTYLGLQDPVAGILMLMVYIAVLLMTLDWWLERRKGGR